MLIPAERRAIVHAEPEHIRALADRLRDADLAEIQSAGLGPMKALWRAYRASIYSKVLFVDGEIAAAWGLGGEPLGRSGQPWLLTSEAVERVPFFFVREGRVEVEQMLRINPVLWGFVDDNYARAIRFLRLLGFGIGDNIVSLGPYNAPFRLYSIDVRH